MKNKTKVVPIVLFLSVFILLVSCQKQSTKWKGTIKEENGVIVVKNPKTPIFKHDVFSLEEDLSIGQSIGDEEYMFARITSLAADDDDRIYVLDNRNAHFKIFDRDGNYFKTVGRQGQGPGEFIRAFRISITSDNQVLVQDRRGFTLNFFTLEGKYLWSQSMSKIPNWIYAMVDSNKNIICDIFLKDEIVLKKYDKDLNELFTICSSFLQKPGEFDLTVPYHSWMLAKSNKIVYAHSDKYILNVLNPEGKLIKKIMKDYDPVKFTEEEKKAYLKNNPSNVKFTFPKNHQAFRRIFLDDEDRIYVLTWEKPSAGEGYIYDVFDDEGKFTTKINMNFIPQLWKNKKLYSIENDEEGYQYVKRYKITWKL